MFVRHDLLGIMNLPRYQQLLRRSLGALLLLLLVLQCIRANIIQYHPRELYDFPQQLACEKSGMCSLGKVKPFLGDVFSSPAMKACLDARSFRKELILLTETRLNPAYQTFRSLLHLGYEHVVMLSSEEKCFHSNATWPRLACVWSTQPLLSRMRHLLDRVAFMARAGRLGYNVLMLDTDVVPFRDLYTLLWAEPLGSASLLAMRDGNGWLNCGVVYIRNARPDGPAAYVLAEVVDRLERWAANPGYFSARGLNSYCWDQQMYSDTLLSALAGRPLSYGCWYRHDPGLKAEWDAAHIQLFGGNPGGMLESHHYLTRAALQWPPELLTNSQDYPNRHSAETWMGTMRIPNSRGDWPVELGGPLYPPTRGETSQCWMQTLQDDGGPMWPDPEDPAQAGAAAAITETFAYLPIYLAESWSVGGALGYWNPALLPPGGQPPVALAHFVHVPGGATNKLTVKMASNRWDWDVAHAAHPNRGIFFASTRAAPLPDVLALDPSLESREWPDEAAFADAVLTLLRLAMEMGRAAAFPAPRCNLSWIGGEKNNKLPLGVNHGFFIPYSPAGKGFNDLRCLWAGYLPYGCQAVRSYFSGGLLAPEYDHLLHLIHQHGTSSSSSVTSSADYLAALGFTVTLDQRALGLTSGEIQTIPAAQLRPPWPQEAWDVKLMADALMNWYGGPGTGLLFANVSTADDDTVAAAVAEAEAAEAAATGRSNRPRVLVLSDIPRLTDRLGPRHELFKQELEIGPDRSVMSCDWIRTGRPYRRRRGRSHRRLHNIAGAGAAAARWRVL
ncbi:hypothetical protein Vretimale_3345 [Volvox reticuliferus]|uniref:Nucleotide-diphospho-sugar transferase domain-containing protein n=1 Tax=Volvox reticuliferus TaxID=1737510 RepID=A0A8J4C2E1_9CHLO|nr:hypothetical protein Vretifemale_909 [Volvox reticuliferus]GIL97794.1 hypothetical protein Vretimale_3345 [Volvox reticuliferus]